MNASFEKYVLQHTTEILQAIRVLRGLSLAIFAVVKRQQAVSAVLQRTVGCQGQPTRTDLSSLIT